MSTPRQIAPGLTAEIMGPEGSAHTVALRLAVAMPAGGELSVILDEKQTDELLWTCGLAGNRARAARQERERRGRIRQGHDR